MLMASFFWCCSRICVHAQTPAPETWQSDGAGDDLDQLDGFQRSGGAATNGGIISGASTGDVILGLTADQTLHSKGTLAVPGSTSSVPVVAVHGRVTLYGSAGSAGVGMVDAGSSNTWYYLLLNGSQIILRRSNGGTESNLGSWTFSPGSSAADIRLLANYSTSGQIAFTVRYGLVGSALTTQTATDASPLNFASGRLRSVIHTRSGRVADFALATRILEPNAEPASVVFPASANVINVLSYGATGNGVTDDTAAIQSAINAAVGSAQGMRTIYFPNGTYLVSKRLEWKNASGQWENYLTLQGQSRAGTIIKLKDAANSGADNFTNPAAPRAVLFTASELNSASPTAGGKDYTNLGEGNAAFGNSLFNLTIDTGTGNPGAIAVDFLSNNSGAVKSVTIRSADGQGVAGLGLIRKWTGPLLVKDVLIDGFATGVLTQNTNYAATLEHVTLRNQTAFGIDNQAGIVLAIRGLLFRTMSASAIAIRNNGGGGLVTIMESCLLGANAAAAAIDNNSGSGALTGSAAIYARDVLTDGFSNALRQNGSAVAGTVITNYVSGGALAKFGGSSPLGLHLAVEETPVFFEPNQSQWVNVQDFGANPDDSADDATAIQAAIDSTAAGQSNAGKTVLHFPQGTNPTSRYLVGSTVTLRHGVRKIEGNFSRLSASGEFFEDWNFPNPVIRVTAGTTADPVFIERLEFRTDNLTVTPVSVELDAPRTLVVKHTDLNGLRTTYNAGKVFLEDVTAHTLTSLFRFEGPSPVYARQLNPEDIYNTKIRIVGSSLWCLGLKTERPGPVLHAAAGARVEILGGLFHNSVHPSPSGLPAVIVDDAAVSLSAATAGSGSLRYDIDVRETHAGVTLSQSLADSPDRLNASSSLLPLYSAWDGTGALTLPTVGVSATVPYASEPSTAGTITFTRSGSTTSALTVNYSTAGTAQSGVDFTALPGSVTIPAGSRSASIAVTPIDDFIAEYPERVSVTVAEGSGYLAGWPAQASVAISDNDVATGTPPAGSLVMWLRADAGVVTDPASGLQAWRDQSGNGNHAINDESLRRPLWQSGVAGQFVSQPQITFENRSFLLLQPSATLQRSAVGFSARTQAVYFRTGADVSTRQVIWEQGSDGRGLNLYLDAGNLYAGAWNAPSSGGWKVFRSTPVAANTEYLAVLVFDAAGQAVFAYLNNSPFSGTSTVTGTVASIPAQGDESTLGGMVSKTLFHDTASNLSGYYFTGALAEVFAWNAVLNATQRTDLQTYIASKYSPTLVLASLAATIPDAAESPYSEGAFTVSRTGSTAAPLTLNYAISGTATNGTDYQTLTGSITLGAGVSSAPILVRPIADGVAEFGETVTVTLQSGPGYSLSGSSSGTVTIRQDVVGSAGITASVAPGNSTVVPVTLTNPSPTTATTFTLDIPTNYTAVRSDSTAANRPAYTWQEIVTNNKRDTVLFDFNNAKTSLDHNTPSAPVSLGFTFPFYGATYSSVRVSPDGWISFDPSASSAPNNLDLAGGNLSAPAAMIAPFWRTQSCNNLYASIATKRVDPSTFVIQWYKTTSETGPDGYLCEIPNYQAILKSDGTIFFNYYLYQVPANPVRPYSIGIQNAARDRALSLRSGIYNPGNATYTTTNPAYLSTLPLSVRLDPPQTWLTASATTVAVPAGGSIVVNLTLDAAAMSNGDSRAFTIPISTSQPGSPAISLPVTLTAETATPPVISTPPADQTVVTGSSASFSVNATGSAPLSYEWQSSEDGSTWSSISGATGTTYNTSAVGLADSGRRFRCLVTNNAGTTPSAYATLTVTLPPSSTARVVNWDGDFVTANQILQGTQESANGDWNADGFALDARRWIAFPGARQPVSGYTPATGSTGNFTGAVLIERYSTASQAAVNAFTAATVGVLNSTTDDRIRIGSDTTGEWAWGLVLFHKHEFLAGTAWDDVCAFDANSRLSLTIASTRNAQARFVVVSGGITYISAPFTATRSNVAPTGLSWSVWTFGTDPSTLKVVAPVAAPSPDFSDITAIGYTVQAQPVADPSTDRSSLNMSAFTADLTISPGPAHFADWTVASGLAPADRTLSADPDGDGAPNLLEYAFGTAPDSFDSRPILDSQISNLKLQLSFLRTRPELTYTVQGSTDLVTWTDLATNPGTIGETVTFTDTADLSLTPRRFLRVKIFQP